MTTIIETSLDFHLRLVTEWIESKGWNDDRTFGDEIALLHSELSEALEAYRDMGFDEAYEYRNGERRSVSQNEEHDLGKPIGVASELADVYIRLLDTCSRHGIDLIEQFYKKMAYNQTRPYRHGGKAL